MVPKTKLQLETELKEAQAMIAKLERDLQEARASGEEKKLTYKNRTKKPQREEDFLKLLEVLPVGVSILDSERKVMFQNSALSRILDMNAEGIRIGAYKNRKYLASDGLGMPADEFASVQAEKSGQAVYNIETGVIKENGETIWTSVSAVPMDLAGWKTIIVTTDITERKQSEIALQHSEEKYSAMFEKSAIPAALTRMPEGVFMDINEAFQSVYGYSRAEVIGKTSLEIGMTLPAERSQTASELKKHNFLRDNEKHLFTKTGEARIGTINISKVKISGQDFVITTIHDVTERKQAEEALKHTRNTLAEAQKIAHMGSFEYIAATQTTLWSEEEYHIYGLDPAGPSPAFEVMLQKCIHPEDAVLLQETFTKAMQSRSIYELEHRIVRPDGSVRWVYDHAHPYFDEQGKLLRYLGITLDITERKQAEEIVRIALTKYQTLFDTFPLGITVSDTAGNVVETNAIAEKLIGISKEEQLQREIDDAEWKVVHPDGSPMPPEEYASVIALKENRKVEDVEMGILKPDGNTTWINVTAAPLSLDGYGVVVTYADMTARKEIENRLKENERKYRELVQNANSAIIRWKSDGTISFFNEFAQSFFGYQQDEVLGKPVGILVPDTDSTGGDLSTLVQSIVENPDQFVNVVNENVRKDGRRVWMAWTNKPVYGEDGYVNEILAVGVDISELKLIEEELRRSNAELEQFAYIASHDLQEPLRAVSGMVQLLQKRYQGQLDERADEYIKQAVDASARMQALIQALLAYSRAQRDNQPIEEVDVGTSLRIALKNLDASIRESHAVITTDTMPRVHANAAQLTQLFQNLIGNGIKFRGDAEPQIHISVTKLKDTWQFSIRDNGIGIEPQYFERIFMIFQRLHTQREYSGTGIGLALCKKIIDRHGGRIWVESEPQHGSIFHFTLPLRSNS